MSTIGGFVVLRDSIVASSGRTRVHDKRCRPCLLVAPGRTRGQGPGVRRSRPDKRRRPMEWAGLAKPYYKIFNRGNAKIPGHDTRWIPQGVTYWPEQDALIISYYDGEHAKNSRLAAIASPPSSVSATPRRSEPPPGRLGAVA